MVGTEKITVINDISSSGAYPMYMYMYVCMYVCVCKQCFICIKTKL